METELFVCLLLIATWNLVFFLYHLNLRRQFKKNTKDIESVKAQLLDLKTYLETHKDYINRENHASILRIQQLSNKICVLEYALKGDKYGVFGEMLSEFPWEKERVKTPLDASNLGYYCVGSVNDTQVWIKRNYEQQWVIKGDNS